MRNVGGRDRFFDTTRGQIILHLMETPQTVSELADRLDLTDNAVRAHLVALERDGVIRQEGERRSGGRPAYVYRVTPQADELFPKAYDRALELLLDVMAERLDASDVEGFLLEAGRRSVDAPDEDASTDDRLQRAREVLQQFGGLPEVETGDDGAVRFTTRSCPLSAVVRSHPDATRLVQGALETVLGVPVRSRCEGGERPACTFEAELSAAAAA